jgi:transcriptional regulator with XRE-family HTH domain
VPRAPGSPHAHGRSELKERPAVMRALREEQRRLGARLRALREERALTQEHAAELIGLHSNHLQRLERGAANVTLATLVALSLAYRVSIRSLFEETRRKRPMEPFRRVASDKVRPFRNAVPLYSLKAAAGRFGAQQQVEPEGWVMPLGRTRPGKGFFVAQVVGDSMRRRIPSGAYCLFRHPVPGTRNGRVLLVQHRQIHDPDHGGRYTVKVYRSRHQRAGPEAGRTVEVRLEPDTDAPGYRPIVLRELEEGELTLVAELVEVLPGA